MEFSDFLKELLGIGDDFELSKIETNDTEKQINIYVSIYWNEIN